MTSVTVSLAVGLLLRVALMLYGLWQDSIMAVKYTDIDYFVFTDAAEFLTKGASPYTRATYRYTPLLAWALQPNIWLTALFGKILFIACDVLAGYFIYLILRARGTNENTSIFCAETWLLNPLPMTVSSRGNAEPIMAVFVLGMLYVLEKSSHCLHTVLAGLIYGLSVHTKIYPATFALFIYLNIVNLNRDRKLTIKGKNLKEAFQILPNWRAIYFIVSSTGVFISLTGICYLWCGMEFIQETYLYHVTRQDTRHNFSPYFLMLYLIEGSTAWVGLAAFLPQIILLILISIKFYDDLPFCCLLQTFVFVSFNKVCTSQYFLWYLSLLPLVIPQLMLSGREALLLVGLWFVGQGVWLTPAYYLEFEGQNTFLYIWLGGLVFFVINIWILNRLIQSYKAPLLTIHEKKFPSISQIVINILTGKSKLV